LQNNKLSDQVRKSIETYFKDLNGEIPCNVYQLVLTEIEKPLLEVVMDYSEQNQSKASKILGINRNTLRKKLENYQLTLEK
jgi:Fis family transcriptional regulator